MNLSNFTNASRLSILSTEEIQKLMMKLDIRLSLNSITFSCSFSSMLQEIQIFTFCKALIHNWSSLAHKLLQIKCLICSLIFIFQIFIFVKVVIIIGWSLVELILLPVLLCLNFFVDVVIIS